MTVSWIAMRGSPCVPETVVTTVLATTTTGGGASLSASQREIDVITRVCRLTYSTTCSNVLTMDTIKRCRKWPN